MFNEICINEEMLPKYSYIYIERERKRRVLANDPRDQGLICAQIILKSQNGDMMQPY